MINKLHLQMQLDELFPIAQRIIEKDGQQHARMMFSALVIDGKAKKCGLVLLPGVAQPEDKLIIDTAREICPPNGFLVVVDEVWAKVNLGKVLTDEDLRVRVRDRKDKMEAVMFHFLGRDWEAMAFHEIKRNPTKLLKGEIITEVGTRYGLHTQPGTGVGFK